jgi:hypothetical protein
MPSTINYRSLMQGATSHTNLRSSTNKNYIMAFSFSSRHLKTCSATSMWTRLQSLVQLLRKISSRFRYLSFTAINSSSLHLNTRKYYEQCYRFIEELENLFNPMMLAQFLSSSGTLCLIIFQITVVSRVCEYLLKSSILINS